MAYNSSSGGGNDGYVQGRSTFKGFSSRADKSNFKLYDFALIRQDLIHRLSVRKGERVENPEFGTSGFNALPGGIRVNSGQYDGLYFSFSFWSVSEYSEWYSFNRKLWNQNSGIGRELIAKNAGLSIRLVKD